MDWRRRWKKTERREKRNERYCRIAVDFDGCLSRGKWPGIGKPNKRLIRWLNRHQKNGDKIILWTCRTGDRLKEAVEACAKWGLLFDRVNESMPEDVEYFGEDESRKVYAGLYIDDRAKRWRAKGWHI